jgi:ribonuclease BN (tRNA processing enzyme)
VELTVVGCSGSVSGPDSPASCYLLQAPYEGRTFSMVLDLGPGAFGALYRHVDPSQVDAITLSHLHPDHCFDVCAFYVAAKYSPTAPWPRRPVFGPHGTAERLARAYDVSPTDGASTGSASQILDHFDYRDWQPWQQIGPFDVHTAPVDHPVAAYGMRVEERTGTRSSVVFSGDTGPCQALTELASGANLLLAESAFMDLPGNPSGLHMSGRDAAQCGADAGVGAVVLTHIPPWHDRSAVQSEARPHFNGPLMLAEPGAHWTIG